MAGSALSMKIDMRIPASLACAVGVIALSGCGITSPSEGQSRSSAEAGIVAGTEYLARSFASYALEGDGSVTAEDLAMIVDNVMVDTSTQAVEGQRRDSTIYGLTSDAATISIRVFVPTAVTVNSGIYSESTDLFGCGTFQADLSEHIVALSDEPCPDWILKWNGDDAEEVSLEELLRADGKELKW